MRKDWFRFDPATWVAVTLAGLLPTGLLLVISSLTLTGMSISLSDLLEEPHRERVRAQSKILAAEIDHRITALRGSLQAAFAPGGDPSGPLPAAAAAVESLAWRPLREPGDAPVVSDEKAELADAVLRNLVHLEDPDDRTAVLRDLATLPPELEDELGFSYALEASLSIGVDVPDPVAVLRAPALDPASLRAWAASGIGDGMLLPSWSLPLRPDLAAPARGRGIVPLALDPEDPTRFAVAVETPGAGTIIATLAVAPFLDGALAAVTAAATPPEGIFFALRQVEATGARAEAEAENPRSGAGTEGREWATWPLPPPFDGTHELVTGTSSAEPPVPLALLRRLEGIHLLWGGLLVVGLALGVSLVLAALASRRVRVSMQKDNFLRLVSHELRTPIAAIRIIAETLSLDRVRSDEERAEFLHQLETESGRLTDLVERVLEFGRRDAGARSREVVTDPGELVQGAVRRFLDSEGERRSQERQEGEPPLGAIEIRSSQLFHPVLLDREAVTGVIHNLLSNARKYSPEGAPIEVTVGEESRELFVAVRDQGPGIRRREQKRIFRSFYRGGNGASKPGFGLGLAYCAQVAQAHRGRIAVASAPGRGSTFTFAVPTAPARPEGADDG